MCPNLLSLSEPCSGLHDSPVIGVTMIEHSVATCLSFHAAYRCRHSGACCRAGWTIPFDHGERETVHALRLAGGSFTDDGHAARQPDGTCSFFEGDTHLCA